MSPKIKKIKDFVSARRYEIHANWNQTGLLNYLSREDSVVLALKLEELAKILSVNFKNFYKEQRAYFVFPIVSRAFRNYNYLIKDCNLVLTYVNSKIHMINNLSSDSVDIEVEFCAQMAKEISDLKL